MEDNDTESDFDSEYGYDRKTAFSDEDDNMMPYDPSKELTTKTAESVKVEIHVLQRNTRKFITMVKNLSYHVPDLKDFLRQVKRTSSCNGSIKDGNLQFTGNQKEFLYKLLTKEYKIKSDMILLRGI